MALVLHPQHYWNFQLLNAAFMVSHGYHSFYECMSIAARHPVFGTAIAPQLEQARKFGGGEKLDNFYSTFIKAVQKTAQLPGKDLWVDFTQWRSRQGSVESGGSTKLSGAFQDVLASMMLIQVLLQPAPQVSVVKSPVSSTTVQVKLPQPPAVYQTRTGGHSFRQGESTSSGLNCYLHTILQLQQDEANAGLVLLGDVQELRRRWVVSRYVNQYGMIEAGNAGPMRGTTELGLSVQIYMLDGQNRLNHVATVGQGHNVKQALLQYNHFTPLWPV